MLTFLSMNRGMVVVEIRQADHRPVSPLVVAMTPIGLIVMIPVRVRHHWQHRIGQIGLTGMRLLHGMMTAIGEWADGTMTTAAGHGTAAGTAGAARAHVIEATTPVGAVMRTADAPGVTTADVAPDNEPPRFVCQLLS